MTIRDIITFIFKWKTSIVAVFLSVVLIVTGLVYVLPPSYQGKSSVLVERNRAPVMRLDFAPGTDMLEVMTTESEIILSRAVMADVVDKLKLDQRKGKDTTMKRIVQGVRSAMSDMGLIDILSPRDKWIKRLQKNVKAKPVLNSNVIDITYSDEDPSWAAKIVNAVTDSYIIHHLRVYDPTGGSELYRNLMETSAKKLDVIRKKLADFKRGASVSALSDTKRETARMLTSLREQKASANADLADLLTKFEPGHERVRQIKAKINRIQKSIDEASNQLKNMDEDESHMRELELDYSTEEQAYKEYKQHYDDTRISELANVKLINVHVVDYASPPSAPPYSRLFLIVLGVGGGLILAFGIAFLREYFDRRVLDPRSIERILGVPELGSIPRFEERPYA